MIGIQSIKTILLCQVFDALSRMEVLMKNEEVKVANEYKEKLHIKAENVAQRISSLWGGNAQKVIFSKWVLSGADVLFLDEPTRGIDVMAKYEIYQIINEMVENGNTVILISSDMTGTNWHVRSYLCDE